ncbi:PEP-CTERM protein-sorting domain-containing protein [Janthinobacterium lividum]|uniref:PEP-CTERM protein-sorting domain-containing protein n=1 Tax=Janthinobacterium lividum TaxID=29581 RepID=A0AB38CDZ4_9BURK|nr:PEP-CTERM sorting domain-containing protein [Janthinobacterium lividum]EZP38466.1 VPEP domain containing protein [Janthinobacterium lividum]SFY13494.1 PEP-CTERM protein-sorting domain-containing protein [Janthinobacterium lividum]
MKKNLLCAALLVAGISTVHAQPTAWDFTYRGFVDAATGVFDSRREFGGSFVGEDSNQDGVIVLDELSYFSSGGYLFFPVTPGSYGCNTSSYLRCEVKNFSYTLTGKLQYEARTYGYDEGSMSWYSNDVIGSHLLRGGGDFMRGTRWENRYNWSDQTTFTISPAPVPEPTVALMLPAGLALMYLARVRRRKTSA